MNGVATITANDGARADAALVQRFRQAQTTRERTAVFADVVRQHRQAVLRSCAQRLWPDADAAVAAAADVLITARLAMGDPAALPYPDRLRGWLLGLDDAADLGEPQARSAPARRWLERIVATLPEPRQRMFDLCVARGLDSRTAALELGTTVAEVRRLRRENRQAILRACEVTVLTAAEANEATGAVVDRPGSAAPGCGELGQLLADARRDAGDPLDGGRHQTVVLPAALRLSVSRHLSQCAACQARRDDCMARWAPELLSILAEVELYEQVMEQVQSMPELRQPGAHRRVAAPGTATMVVVRRPATIAAGAGLLAAALLVAFVWPGVLLGTRAATAMTSPARNRAVAGGAPTVTGTVGGLQARSHGHPAPSGAAGLMSSLPPTPAATAASSSAAVQPSAYYMVPPSATPTSSTAQPTPGPSSTSSSPSASPSAQPTTASPTPSPTRSTSPPTTPPAAPPSDPPTSPSTPTPTPSASTSTPTPTPSASTSTPTPTPSGSSSTPTPTPSATSATPTDSATDPSSSASPTLSPTLSASTAAPSASADS